MSLCISLYTHQMPSELSDMIAQAQQTQEIAKKTLQEASAEVE